MKVIRCDGCQKLISLNIKEPKGVTIRFNDNDLRLDGSNLENVDLHACSEKCAIDVIHKYFINKEAERIIEEEK